MDSLVKIVASLDHKISTVIHHKDNILLSTVLYPFAAFFHPGLIWLAYLLIYLFSSHNIHFTIVYAFGTLCCLIATTLLKKVAKRPRPALQGHLRKPHHFRKKEKNNAMPSGDAFQSALFVTFLHFLGVELIYLALFHIGVCLGRVYYMCHWFMDTVAATVLGISIGQLILMAYDGGHFAALSDYSL